MVYRCIKLGDVGKSKLSSIFRRKFSQVPGRPSFSQPVLLDGVREIIDKYEIFIIEPLGSLHNSQTAFPGSIELMKTLKEKNKKVILLSNSSTRTKAAGSRYFKLGFEHDFHYFLTSGEIARNHLAEFHQNKKITYITWKNHLADSSLRGLNITFAPPEYADFILFNGTQCIVTSTKDPVIPLNIMHTGQMEPALQSIFERAARRKLPMIVTNSNDSSWNMENDKEIFLPGRFIAAYQELGGGEIIPFGKPSPDYFLLALQGGFQEMGIEIEKALADPELMKKAIHIGDSLPYDVLGARMMGIDTMLVTHHGAHREVLHQMMKETSPQMAQALKSKDPVARRSFISQILLLCESLESLPPPTYVMTNLQY